MRNPNGPGPVGLIAIAFIYIAMIGGIVGAANVLVG